MGEDIARYPLMECMGMYGGKEQFGSWEDFRKELVRTGRDGWCGERAGADWPRWLVWRKSWCGLTEMAGVEKSWCGLAEIQGVENEMEEEGNGEKYCFVQGGF